MRILTSWRHQLQPLKMRRNFPSHRIHDLQPLDYRPPLASITCWVKIVASATNSM
jgi:hypothetical protein